MPFNCETLATGFMIAGIILLLMLSYNWYQDSTSTCATKCNQTHATCKKECDPTRVGITDRMNRIYNSISPSLSSVATGIVETGAAAGTYLSQVASSITNPTVAATASTEGFKSSARNPFGEIGPVSEYKLEHFLGSRGDETGYNAHDYVTQQSNKPDGDETEGDFDPAKLALEDSIYQSHAEFAAEADLSTTSTAALQIRDDPNDVVPWRGLKRPDYQGVFSADDSRVVSSEEPSQMISANATSLLF